MEKAYGIAIDDFGNIFVTGETWSTDFDLLNQIEGDEFTSDAFIFKLEQNENIPTLAYSTYIGGDNNDIGNDIAVDGSGNVYVTGMTRSSNFNTVNPIEEHSGGADSFVIKIGENENVPTIIYSTYIGGSNSDVGVAIATNDVGGVYVVGRTFSTDFDQLNAIQDDNDGWDAFLFKIDDLENIPFLEYSTYISGNGSVGAGDIVVGPKGSLYLCGSTTSDDFFTLNSINSRRGSSDAYLIKFVEVGNSLSIVYSTLFGGTNGEGASNLVVDNFQNVFITGITSSNDFDPSNPYIGTIQDSAVFVSKIKENDKIPSLISTSYFGGNDWGDLAEGIAIDSKGRVYITGYTELAEFDENNNLVYPDDIFLLEMVETENGHNLIEVIDFKGSNNNFSFDIALDLEGNIYIAGSTDSPDINLLNTIESGNIGEDVFLAKILVKEEDFIDPQITPSTNIIEEATGLFTSIDLGTATATDNVSSPENILITNNAPAEFPLGITLVTWTAEDEAGNTASAIQKVTVQDTTPPVISLLGDNPLTLEKDEPFSDPGATALDLVYGDLSAEIVSMGSVDTSTIGSYKIEYEVTDDSGNKGTATRTVNVVSEFQFVGFERPLRGEGESVIHKYRVGRTILARWSLPDGKGGFHSDPSLITSRQFVQVKDDDCIGEPTVGAVPVDIPDTGRYKLRFLRGIKQYLFFYRPDRYLPSGCYDLVVTLSDGSQHLARFEMRGLRQRRANRPLAVH